MIQLRSDWQYHPGQQAVVDSDARFRIVAAGRRWGKSEMCAHLAFEHALSAPKQTIWWVAPSYQQANEFGFDNLKEIVPRPLLADSPKLTEPREIRFTNGSVVSFRSADRQDALRGGGVDLLVIDEAGSVPERAWIEELRPALSDTEGDMVAIGTPRGRNWFYHWFKRGQSDDHPAVTSWQAPMAMNPYVADSEVESAREQMPERKFRQEIEAKFIDDAGGVFRGVRDCVQEYALPVPATECEGPYSIGVDFARQHDWTVIVVLDATGRLVAFDRLQQVPWSRIQSAVERFDDRYPRATVALDATRDNQIVENLASAGVSVDRVTFSASTKTTMIENLITHIENGTLTLSSDAPHLITELEVFEYEQTDSGAVRYQAPSGAHDDCVDALALAARTVKERRLRVLEPSTVGSSWSTSGGHGRMIAAGTSRRRRRPKASMVDLRSPIAVGVDEPGEAHWLTVTDVDDEIDAVDIGDEQKIGLLDGNRFAVADAGEARQLCGRYQQIERETAPDQWPDWQEPAGVRGQGYDTGTGVATSKRRS